MKKKLVHVIILPKEPNGFLLVVMPDFVFAVISSGSVVDSKEGYSKTCVKLSLNVMFLCKRIIQLSI